ncbi:MAG: hypothetical protein DHS20C13_27340 [Thermodesulfobacteriota bacterium]|nr:MAG: hypothetical protein DHS20C13_27340 [Thermodesulfobacteriota bacterium]
MPSLTPKAFTRLIEKAWDGETDHTIVERVQASYSWTEYYRPHIIRNFAGFKTERTDIWNDDVALEHELAGTLGIKADDPLLEKRRFVPYACPRARRAHCKIRWWRVGVAWRHVRAHCIVSRPSN